MCLAVPGKIEKVLDGESVMRTARVSFGGIVKEVNLACVPEAQVGDYVLVHAGIAISIVDPAEAERVFEYLEEAGDLEDLQDRPDEIRA